MRARGGSMIRPTVRLTGTRRTARVPVAVAGALLGALLFAAACGSSSSSESDTLIPATDTGAGADTGTQEDATPPECSADDDCAARFADLGVCERATCASGRCVRGDAADYVACDDGDACSVVSWCLAGACTAGLARGCDDGDPCTRDTCDATAGGCVHAPLDGISCDDGDPCTRNDRCTAGVCGGAADAACACATDADCLAREDGDLCNGLLRCTGGRCAVDPATVVRCDTTGDALCRPTTCDPATGACAPTPATDGTACEDGNLCTRDDACHGGVCEGGAYACEPCAGDAQCAPHDDGDDCNGTLRCVEDTCVTDAATVVTCSTTDPCGAAYCDAATGECATAARADGAWCDDGDACTAHNRCAGGACAGAALDCDDGDPCTDDACAAATGCAHTAIPGCACETAAQCDDEDPCTDDDCGPDGTCRHTLVAGCRCATAADCDDGNPCTDDACDDATDACEYTVRADDAPCGSAADACHEADQCRSGACVAGPPVSCDDGVACTTDSCDPAIGCRHTPTAACDCVTAADCDDDNPCTEDGCDDTTRRCTFAPGTAGTACSDGNACTDDDRCDAAGACQPGAAVPCSDGDPCTADECVPATGCAFPPAEDGTGCDDGDACTGPDTCAGGECAAGPLTCERDCDDRLDDDDDGDTDCDDADCAADAACAEETDCRDGLDGDGDGDTDCADSDCDGLPCGPPESACGDDLDNDRDGDTDCDDADCAAAAPCNPEADCENGADDDLDGDTDCADGDCAADATCNPETDCRNGVDDDRHGDTDCADPDCAADVWCHPESDCDNGLDDDEHGDTDCADPDCAAALNCLDLCLDAVPIVCDELGSGTNVGVESLVAEWACGPQGTLGWPGGEVVYAFTPVADNDAVTARLVEFGTDHDLFLLDAACDARSCDAYGSVEVTFAATAGETVYLVVDGYGFAPTGAFGLVLECPTGPATETDCDDGLDDDTDGDTDCDDDDCAADAACTGPSCTPVTTIACEQTRAGTTLSGPTRIGVYGGACEAINAGAPERAYAFTAEASGPVRARVRPQAGLDLDLRVLEDECEPEACVEEGTFAGPDTVTWNAVAGTTYYLLVDAEPGQVGPFNLDLTCGCTDDAFEDNDSQFAPTVLQAGGHDDLQLCPLDQDWYALDLCAGAQVAVDVAYDLAEGNIDVEVFDQNFQAVTDDVGSDPAAHVAWTAATAGRYSLLVYLNSVQDGFTYGNSYDLTVSVDTSDCVVAPALCTGATPLTCGQTRSGDNRGVLSAVGTYGCAEWSEPGGEVVYTFTAPRAVTGARLTVAPTLAGFDPDVFVLGSSCDPQLCVAHDGVVATFDALAGSTYYVVVDGFDSGPAGTFDVTLTCPEPVEDCDNLADDDGDNDVDCADEDCVDAPNCVQRCASAWTLACGEDDGWSTISELGVVSAIDRYLCAPKDAAASDYVYDFTPGIDASVTVTLLSDTPGVDLDLYVLEAACAANTCVASGTADDDAGEIVTFAATAGTTYYLAVDGAAGEEGDFDVLVECAGPPTLCGGATPITCGQTVDGDNADRESLREAYTCSGLTGETGGEVVYAFTPAEDLLDVTAAIVAEGALLDHDVYVLDAACDPTDCVYGDVTAGPFDALAGETLYIVVEGYDGTAGPFSLELACPTASEDCADGVDNDADGDTDCDDLDCAGTAACVACEPYAAECGLADDFTTTFGDNVLSDYACAGPDASGPDVQYAFTLEHEQRLTVTLTPDVPTAALDLYVLAGACDGASCIEASATAGVETVSFVAAAGVTYYVVVDGAAGPGADYNLTATCEPASVALCTAPEPIFCNAQVAGDTAGVTSLVSSYACEPWTEAGGERVYAFSPSRDVRGATAGLVSTAAAHDVFLLDATCDAAGACLAAGDTAVTFNAQAGETYHLVVDSAAATSPATFVLGLTCPEPPASEVDCGDGLDEDADTITDCEDVDCELSAECNGTCAAPTPIDCDQAVLGSTAGRLSLLNGYPCGPSGDDESGAETVYRFAPATDVDVELAPGGGWNTEILILEDACAPAACVQWFDAFGTFSFTGGHVYYIVIDGRNGANGHYGLTFTCLN